MTDSLRWLDTKVPPPLVMVIVAIGMWLVTRVTPAFPLAASLRLLMAGSLTAAGVVFGVAGLFAFRRARTTVNPTKPERTSQLVIAGVYRVSRSPMYLGLLLILLAVSAQLAAPLALAGPVVFAGYIDRFQIKPEERALESKFGDAYVDYKRRVRRWL